MSEAIFYAVYLILSLAGLLYFLWFIFCRLMCSKNGSDDILTFVSAKNPQDLPDKVYNALLLTKYQPFGKREVYVVAEQVPYHTKLLCQNCAENIGMVHFITPEQLLDIFQNRD